MKWQNLLYGLFAIALVSSGTFWFLKNFELQNLDQFTGFKGEARSNSLFAARLLIKRMGIPAERQDGLLTLPGTNTVILLNTERFSLSLEKTEELLAWVERGGHLITRARVDVENEEQADTGSENQFVTEDRDELQARLGISIGPHQMPDEDQLPALIKPADDAETLSIDLDFFNELRTDSEDAVQQQLDDSTWMLEQPYGEGLVTLLSTMDFFENPSLEDADHGKLLWYLLHSHKPNPEQVWLVHQDTLPSLIVLLVRHASAVLITMGLFIAFIFWALIPRFGAVIPEPPPQRRRILDHIKASGQFLWKRQTNGREQLCQTLQQNIEQTAQRQIPGWQFMPLEEQHQALAEYTQQTTHHENQHSPAVLKDGFHGNNHKYLNHLLSASTLDEQDFTHLVQLARRLRKPT